MKSGCRACALAAASSSALGINRRKITHTSTSIWAMPVRSSGPIALRYSVSIRAWAHMKLIRQIVLTVTWTELKSSNAASLVMLPVEDGSGDDRTGLLNWAVGRAALAERPGIRLPRSVAGAAHGTASSRAAWDHSGLHRQQA